MGNRLNCELHFLGALQPLSLSIDEVQNDECIL